MNTAPTASRDNHRLIGGDLSQVPYISPFGRLFRLSRLNGLWLHQFREVLKTTPQIQEGLRGGFLPWRELYRWEASIWSQGDDLLPHSWEDWHPFGDKSKAHPTKLRGCRTCLAHGFHTMFHQLPWITTCPWHEEGLVENCACGCPLLPNTGRSAKIRLLACPCGVDHYQRNKALRGMNQWPKERVRQVIHEYLDATSQTRSTTHLITADRDGMRAIYGQFVHESAPLKGGDGELGANPFARRRFDEDSGNRAISNTEVGSILRAWHQSPVLQPGVPYPILMEHYDRIIAYASEAQRQLATSTVSMPVVKVSRDCISVYGKLIVAIDPQLAPAANVGAHVTRSSLVGLQLLHSVYNPPNQTNDAYRMKQMDDLTLWSMQSPAAKVLAYALSHLSSLCALDYIRAALERERVKPKRSRFMLRLGEPIALVVRNPTLRIDISYLLPIATKQGTLRES